MTFAWITDEKRVYDTITHPRIWPWVSDDMTPSKQEYRPLMGHPAVLYAGVFENGEYMGLWQFTMKNAVTWEVHTCLLPACWGKKAVAACRAVAEWFWQQQPGARRIVTCVPVDNPLALKLATSSGMKSWGRNPGAYLRRGRLLDEVWFGSSRPEEVKECQ